jgi:hypothetical protein
MRCAAFPATFGAEKASSSGSQAPMGRAAHPDEITPGRADPAETDGAAFSISGSASSSAEPLCPAAAGSARLTGDHRRHPSRRGGPGNDKHGIDCWPADCPRGRFQEHGQPVSACPGG